MKMKEAELALELRDWEMVLADAIGVFIDAWGFKRNQGRLWAILFIRDEPMTSNELQRYLSISKGGISILARELEAWGVIKRTRPVGEPLWHFEAERDLMAMIARVLRQREAGILRQVREGIAEARALAKDDQNATPAEMRRLDNMYRISDMVEKSLKVFLRTARLDLAGALSTLAQNPTKEN
jgi:HTH-type transcriptional regulator, glycine betaine synthesis regulator